MSVPTTLCLVGFGTTAIAIGGAYVYKKYRDIKLELQVANTKNELNDRIISAQQKLLDELETKLKRKG